MPEFLSALLLGIATLSAGMPADASSLIDAVDPEKVAEVARGFGSAKVTTDNEGDPMIEGRINGVAYRAFFYLCEDGKQCKDILLWAGWEGYDISVEAVNSWNAEMRFGTAYIDAEGDPCLHMPINLNHGVSRQNLDDTFDWWATILGKYTKNFLANDGELKPD